MSSPHREMPSRENFDKYKDILFQALCEFQLIEKVIVTAIKNHYLIIDMCVTGYLDIDHEPEKLEKKGLGQLAAIFQKQTLNTGLASRVVSLSGSRNYIAHEAGLEMFPQESDPTPTETMNQRIKKLESFHKNSKSVCTDLIQENRDLIERINVIRHNRAVSRREKKD